ncbi:MAG TPA: MBL fold metallo-hydrolase [Thermotogota bacterium]|nr:MBL fold metallo-hydrolase [Thermotogota bacterium]
MKIRWLGHSCFEIRTSFNILTDPYDKSVTYHFDPVDIQIITESHQHHDHNAHDRVPGDPAIVKTVGEHAFDQVMIKGYPSYHDREQGKKRGNNIIFQIVSEGITLTHLGDLGHQLGKELLKKLAGTDVLMIPVGGTYTIDANEAVQLIEQLKPKVVVPMHYKTPSCDYPIAELSDFTDALNWKRVEVAILELNPLKLQELNRTCVIFQG